MWCAVPFLAIIRLFFPGPEKWSCCTYKGLYIEERSMEENSSLIDMAKIFLAEHNDKVWQSPFDCRYWSYN